MNVFSGVTSPRVFSYRFVLQYLFTMPVGFNFHLTYELKPQVSGIKIATVYKNIHFPRLVAHCHLILLVFLTKRLF